MGILSRFFGGGDDQKSGVSMSQKQAVRIIQEYGTFIEHHSPTPGCVADASQLPQRKDAIKAALIVGLRANSDPQIKELLKTGFIQLADWQEGVGEVNQGIDLTNIDLNEDVTKLAEKVLAQGKGQEKWTPVAEAERAALRQELVNLGLW